MRRSFKLATAFTGVAALSGGYGPTALAATTPAAAVHPDIGNRVCGANNGGVSNWVHLYYPNNNHPAECFGGAGGTPVNATIASFCPGNNNGDFLADGIVSPVTFHHSSGRNNIGTMHISYLYISNWSGHAKCT
jgi:hypothetical protein